MRLFSAAGLALAAAMLCACAEPSNEAADSAATTSTAADDQHSDQLMSDSDNPFFSASGLQFQYPPFDAITNAHYLPGFEAGMREQTEEIEAIAGNAEPPTVENTIIALERSGRILARVSSVFYAQSSAHTNDTIRAVEAEIAPRISAHNDDILLNPQLFERVEGIFQARATLDIDAETLRLIEETRRDFVRAGALLSDEDKNLLREINAELAELDTQFTQNVLKEVNRLAIVVNSAEELAGFSPAEIEAAADAAGERDLDGSYVIPLLNTTQQPALGTLQNRTLRERILRTSMSRGSSGGEFDNREILSRTAELRARKARMLGYPTHAAYRLELQTAQTVEAVNEQLGRLTPPAVANARREADDLQALIDAEGQDFTLAAWDWAFYADKLRAQRYEFDESRLRPYFELDNVLHNGVFFAAGQIYGLRFEERDDLPVYQEDVRVFEVFEEDGTPLSLFIFDPYARPSKRGGAWMNRYVSQSKLLGTRSVVANHINIPEPPPGEPTLLTFTEVTTMFHEFGHALHGMFSNVTYPSFSGTSVPRDFVEFPSQVNEMWATWPDVLENYAVHYETGEPMPRDLLDKVLASQQFNEGYATTEYLAASIIDMALHTLSPEDVPSAADLMQFEAQTLAAAGADLETVPPRYRYPYFSHILGGYSAGYYSYIWSEVLDADTVEWFRENGGMTRANGQHFRDTLLSRGGSAEAMSLFRDFRGRDPEVGPLLERRGLNPVE
ncbi:MAG TPA: M3 family metallopeptidase [Gammaproteobacteria bacterium]|nr:M3 family metallopeptidase [Gammaproteobacteria bacterium]